ncbi:MAG: bifunctional nuclease family protein [Chitinophagaceae bacterium]|jgi:uncharacterized protein|nr:bifunctional nuclease family protein [Chitinophagaceae bacterium]
MIKKEVQIVALSTSESSPGNYVVILEEITDKKRMAIVIGAFEAQAIAVHLERMKLPRPLTHDVLKATIDTLGGKLKEVIIHNIIDKVYYAWLVLETSSKEEQKIDARASDALAISIRYDCPVYVYDFVLEESVINEPETKNSLIKGSLADYSLDELESLLQDVLAKEDYESATRIRDIIRKRKNS